MAKRKPTHPGKMLKNILEGLNLSQAQAAKLLGISRKSLKEFVTEKTRCTPEMASRLAHALDMNTAAWINNYDAWNAKVEGKELETENEQTRIK